VFLNTGTLTGPGVIFGIADLTFSNAGTITGTGSLAGESALVFLNTGTLTGPPAAPTVVLDLLAPVNWRDREFEALARILEMGRDLDDLERFVGELEAAGEEYVDPFASTVDNDSLEEREWTRKVRSKNYSR
jgi:hypothetical protein